MAKKGNWVVTHRDDIQIDLNLMPKWAQDSFYGFLVERLKEFYKDPENMRKFEEWKKERDRQRRAERKAEREAALKENGGETV